MSKRVFAVISVFFLALTLSGCIGYVYLAPAECKNETPTIFAREREHWTKAPLSPMPTKADFLKAWGQPDMINSASDNEEIWIYERKNAWCGIVPAFLVAVPILLPACDVFERIEFHGEDASNLDIKRIVTHCYMGTYGGGCFESEPACRKPLPVHIAEDSVVAKPDPHIQP